MGLVIRNGRAYFQESYRVGGRVTSRYCGAGEVALLLAVFREEDRREREAERLELEALRREEVATRRHEQGETRRLRDRITLTDRMVGAYFRRVTKMVDQTLTALGYHRLGRGWKWHRKRGFSMANELARVDVHELVRLAGEGDRLALGELADRYRIGSTRRRPTVRGISMPSSRWL